MRHHEVESTETNPVHLNAKGYPMVAIKHLHKNFPTKQVAGKRCSNDRKVAMPIKLGKYRPCQLALQEIKRYQQSSGKIIK